MNTVFISFPSELTEALGWTIVHSIWQGIVIVITLALLLLLLKRNSSQVRYLISFFALLLMIVWSVYTFRHSHNYAKEKTALKEHITSNPEYIQNMLNQSLLEKYDPEAREISSVNLRWIELRSFLLKHFNLLLWLWMLGMGVFILRITGGFLFARRLRTQQLVQLDQKWLIKLDEYIELLGIKRKVEAFFSPLVQSPLTIGTLKPVILFPLAAFTGLSMKDVEAIIAHELAHVLRHDYLFNILQSIVEIVFFYSPAVWIISKQIRNERENSCDNIAVELTGDKVAYVKALAKIQIQQSEQGNLAMAIASENGSVLNRIKRLQKKVAMRTNFIEGLIAATIVVIGLTLVSFTMRSNLHSQVLPTDEKPYSQALEAGQTEQQKVQHEVRVDSLRRTMKVKIEEKSELNQLSDEIEQIVEIALSETNQALSAEMLEEISSALEELNLEEILQGAMREVEIAIEEIDTKEIIKEARSEIDHEEIRHELESARREIEKARHEVKEEIRKEMENEHLSEELIEISIKAAEAGLDAAEAVLENLPLDEIIDAALEGAASALEILQDIDFDTVFESIEDLDDEFSEEELEELKKQLDQKQEQLKDTQQEKKEIKNKVVEEEVEK